MKKLISRNPVLRFKQGGIPKLLTAWSPINFFDQVAEDYQRRQERLARRAAGDTRAKKNTVSKLLDALWNIGAFKGIKTNKGKEVNYEQAVDGLTGRMTRAAIAKAKELGYDVDESTGTISNGLSKLAASERSRIRLMQLVTPKEPILNPKPVTSSGAYAPSLTYSLINNIGENLGQKVSDAWSRFVNSTPVMALLNRKAHGILGKDAEYTSLPQGLIDVLSDLNQYIFDNWQDAFNHNLSIALKTLYNNMLRLKDQNLSDDERQKLLLEVENNKSSIDSIKQKIIDINKSGGLKEWLVAHPNEKMVVGANFAFYKNRNQHRFGDSIPAKYADFSHESVIPYALSTPLGQVEYILGNNVLSFMYSPETLLILTKASDTYDFNRHGNENDKGVAKLRNRAGTDEDLSSKGSIRYSVDLKPISLNGDKNYTSNFGEVNRETNSFENFLLNLGLRYYER